MTRTRLLLTSAALCAIFVIAASALIFYNARQNKPYTEQSEFVRIVAGGPQSRVENSKTEPCPQFDKGDYDCSGVIDLSDFDAWTREFESQPEKKSTDGNGDGAVTLQDYEIWREGFVTPEQ